MRWWCQSCLGSNPILTCDYHVVYGHRQSWELPWGLFFEVLSNLVEVCSHRLCLMTANYEEKPWMCYGIFIFFIIIIVFIYFYFLSVGMRGIRQPGCSSFWYFSECPTVPSWLTGLCPCVYVSFEASFVPHPLYVLHSEVWNSLCSEHIVLHLVWEQQFEKTSFNCLTSLFPAFTCTCVVWQIKFCCMYCGSRHLWKHAFRPAPVFSLPAVVRYTDLVWNCNGYAEISVFLTMVLGDGIVLLWTPLW